MHLKDKWKIGLLGAATLILGGVSKSMLVNSVNREIENK